MSRALLAWLVLTAPACGGPNDDSPEDAFRMFASALKAAREDSDHVDRVYALLSTSDRRELTRRAESAARLGGEKKTGAEMIVVGRIQIAWEPRKVEVARRSGRRAELAVSGSEHQRARVVMVEERDGWRVSLGLASGASP